MTTMSICRFVLPIALIAAAGCSSPTPDRSAATPSADSTASAPDSNSAEAAADVIRGYYAAIDAHDYQTAWFAWGEQGPANGQTYEQFVRGFANTASVSVTVGPPGGIEGAAGSRYIEIPVDVHARTQDGRDQRFMGSYVLRRAEVDGATREQRRWHFSTATLRETTATR